MTIKEYYLKIRKVLRREDAATTVEFVVLFPIVLLVFFIAAENVVVNLKSTILDSALDRTIRELRLGMIPPPVDQATLKTMICERMGSPVGCKNDLVLELTVATFSASGSGLVSLPSSTATCVNKSTSINPVVSFALGVANDLVFVRACYTVDVSFPMTVGAVSVADKVGNTHQLVSTAVFMNEPN